MRYRRAYQNGGCYFFTVVTAGRRPILASASAVDCLRDAFRRVKTRHLFTLDAIVILPDHLHCVWQLPVNDGDFSIRWLLVKTFFSKHAGHPRPCWQPRFWEHLIRDEKDYSRHIDYIHYNPVKHGYVDRPEDWRYSSFCRFVRRGFYPPDWGATTPDLPTNIGRERGAKLQCRSLTKVNVGLRFANRTYSTTKLRRASQRGTSSVTDREP